MTKFLTIIRDTALCLFGLFGLLCLGVFIATYFFGFSIMLVRTGSMEPTIPAGSAVLVHEVSAEEAAVGDILTLDAEPHEVPVTHRVIDVDHQDDGTAVIEMQGDANSAPDPRLYEVETAQSYVGHIPGVASIIYAIGTAPYRAGITVLAAMIVLWGFWPARQKSHDTTAPAWNKDATMSYRGADAGTPSEVLSENEPHPLKETASA